MPATLEAVHDSPGCERLQFRCRWVRGSACAPLARADSNARPWMAGPDYRRREACLPQTASKQQSHYAPNTMAQGREPSPQPLSRWERVSIMDACLPQAASKQHLHFAPNSTTQGRKPSPQPLSRWERGLFVDACLPSVTSKQPFAREITRLLKRPPAAKLRTPAATPGSSVLRVRGCNCGSKDRPGCTRRPGRADCAGAASRTIRWRTCAHTRDQAG